MYLYLKETDPGDERTDFGKYRLEGFLPSVRGRPPKNHIEHLLASENSKTLTYHTALIPKEFNATTAGELKDQATITLEFATDSAGDSRMNELALAVIVTLEKLEKHPKFNQLDRNMHLQLSAALRGLRVAYSNAYTAAATTEFIEILTNNKSIINSALHQLNLGWVHGHDLVPIQNEKSDDTDNPPSGDSMSATATAKTAKNSIDMAYGIERFGGDRPELKVADSAEKSVSGVFAPKPDDTYIISENTKKLFKILQISRKNSPQNINLIGPHGCGKTELAIQFAAQVGVPMLIMDCANLREARDWFGFKTAREGTVYWHESQFVRAVEAGNHVILLDELNRANPHILNTLMPLLDARRFTFLEEKGDKICVGPGTVFFATMNEGAGYTGTASLDRAFRDRFPRVVELNYLDKSDEIKLLTNRTGISKDIAKLLVEMANKIRQDATGLSATLTESVSTRQLLAAAADFKVGGVETLQFTISNHFSPDGDDESERVKVQNIIQGKFGHLLAAEAGAAVEAAPVEDAAKSKGA